MPTSSKPSDPYLLEKQVGPSEYAAKAADTLKKPKKKTALTRFMLGDGLAGQAMDSLRKAKQKVEDQTR